jgi:hypothetical protein
MALFGRAYRLDQGPVKLEEEMKRGGTEQVRQIGGFMAPWTRKNLPRTIQVLGAGLQQIGDNRGQLSQFSANEAEQQRYAAQEALQGREMKLEDEQRGNMERAIGTLDPSMQPWARMAPGAAAARALAPPEQPEYEIDANGRPYTIQGGQIQYGQGQVAVRQPGEGAGRVQYRPVTPQEAQMYNLPGNGAGFVMGSNGRPVRVGGGGSFSPDQRARVEIGLDPAMEAVRTMDQLELRGNMPVSEWNRLTPDQRRARQRSSPRNSQWGASVVDFIDGEGTSAAARTMGGQDFQSYTSAGSAFESGMLPILSGAAVTESEARRMIRAAIPQLGDGPQVLEQKARRRRQMLNGAAIIGGRNPPYPQDAVPEWASRAGQSGADEGGDLPDGLTPEEWEVMTPEERAIFQ